MLIFRKYGASNQHIKLPVHVMISTNQASAMRMLINSESGLVKPLAIRKNINEFIRIYKLKEVAFAANANLTHVRARRQSLPSSSAQNQKRR